MTVSEAKVIIEGLWKQQGKLERAAAKASDTFASSIALAEQKTLSRMIAEIAKLPNNYIRWSTAKKVNWLANQQRYIADTLTASGYTKAGADYIASMDKMYQLSIEAMKKAGWDASFFETMPKEFLNLVKNNTLSDLSLLGKEATNKISKTMTDMMIAGHTKSSMLSELKGVITGDYAWGSKRGLYEWHAGTYVRTESSKVIQSFMNLQAQEIGAEEFLYLGPYDNKTRPFCADLVGGVYKKEEIEEMDNGQSGDVMSDCGGYNCRHHLFAVPNELAKVVRENEELQRAA